MQLFQKLDDKIVEKLYQENVQSSKIVFFLTPLIFVSWSFFDYHLENQFWVEFFFLRMIFAVTGITFLFFSKTDFFKKNHSYLAFILYFEAVLAILYMILKVDHTQLYIDAFTAIFYAASVFILIKYRYFVLPIIIALFVLVVFKFTAHQDLKINWETVFMIHMTCYILSSTINIYSFRNAYNKQLLKEELLSKNAQLKFSTDENKNLMRILCHDLNNTLSIVMGTNQINQLLIEKQRKKEDVDSKFLDAVLSNVNKNHLAAERQNEIISSIRTFQKVISRDDNIELTSVPLERIFKNVDFIFQQSLNKKNIKIEYLHTGLNVDVLAEEVSLSNSVINNLVSNAIKFSPPENKIIINVQDTGDDYIIVSVEDKGVGIPEDILNKMFNIDSHTSRPGTEGEKGTGFGMPLVKIYMDAYDGRVEVESKTEENDHGTKFKLFFKKPSAKV